MKRPITLFTWGYWGWGNSAKQLIDATCIVEEARGFRRPFFVDIRWKRSGKAPDFVGSNFEKMLNTTKGEHYRYMRELGNRGIETGGIDIAEPKHAAVLLKCAVELGATHQRVIFYCACDRVRWDNDLNCHREEVARLVLDEARMQNTPVEIIEWPGDEPKVVELEIDQSMFTKVLTGRATVPLKGVQLHDLKLFAGLPWGSIVTLQCAGKYAAVISGPAQYEGEWLLPVLNRTKEGILCKGGEHSGCRYDPPPECRVKVCDDPGTEIPDLQREALRIRKYLGLNKRVSSKQNILAPVTSDAEPTFLQRKELQLKLTPRSKLGKDEYIVHCYSCRKPQTVRRRVATARCVNCGKVIPLAWGGGL